MHDSRRTITSISRKTSPRQKFAGAKIREKSQLSKGNVTQNYIPAGGVHSYGLYGFEDTNSGKTMANKDKDQGGNLFKAIIMTHIILFLHLLIIIVIVLMVIFFREVTQHMLWVILGAIVLFLLSGLIFYRHIKSKGKKMIHDIENSSLFQGRSVEISFLRGLASLKFGQPDDLKALENPSSKVNLQLEDPETIHIRDLTELARMYEKDLITSEEYNRAKDQILKSL